MIYYILLVSCLSVSLNAMETIPPIKIPKRHVLRKAHAERMLNRPFSSRTLKTPPLPDPESSPILLLDNKPPVQHIDKIGDNVIAWESSGRASPNARIREAKKMLDHLRVFHEIESKYSGMAFKTQIAIAVKIVSQTTNARNVLIAEFPS